MWEKEARLSVEANGSGYRLQGAPGRGTYSASPFAAFWRRDEFPLVRVISIFVQYCSWSANDSGGEVPGLFVEYD